MKSQKTYQTCSCAKYAPRLFRINRESSFPSLSSSSSFWKRGCLSSPWYFIPAPSRFFHTRQMFSMITIDYCRPHISERSQGMKLLVCVYIYIYIYATIPEIVPECYSFYGTDVVYRCAVGHCTLSLCLSLSHLFPFIIFLCARDALVAEKKSNWVSGFDTR